MSLSSFKFNGSSLLIWVLGGITAYFLMTTALGLWNYWRFEKKSMAVVETWKIIEKSPSQFAIKARYSFLYQGKEYRGKTTFSKPYYLNRLSAEKQMKTYASAPWPVWVYPSDPQQSTLQRQLPLKKCLYSLIVLGIFFYFVYLREQASRSR